MFLIFPHISVLFGEPQCITTNSVALNVIVRNEAQRKHTKIKS